jgi:hypothetical protein
MTVSTGSSQSKAYSRKKEHYIADALAEVYIGSN